MSRRIAALTDRGLKRAINEDGVLARELPDGSVLLAVADGVGGIGNGDIASMEAIHVLALTLLTDEIDDPAAALTRAFTAANERVRAAPQRQPGPGKAATLVAALVRDGSAWVANVGVSRAYLFHETHLRQLTNDHSLVAEGVRAGVLTAAEAEKSAYRNVITRGIGVDETVKPDTIGPVQLPAGSLLLLCSDGLYRMVNDREMAEALASGTPQEIAEGLIRRANEAGGRDNIAVVIVRSE